MHIRDFDYELPPELIARHPLHERDAARMLVLEERALADRFVRDLPAFARPGDVWVINDTKVIPARLIGRKATVGRVEILLLESLGGDELWRAWGRANKPLAAGQRIGVAPDFAVEIVSREGRELIVRLLADDGDALAALERCGRMPLPPYIDRPDGEEDRDRYQTVFAARPGAVAAPTAGLHLTPALLAALEAAGARIARVTLHVGPGTFQPVQVERIEEHRMHEEAFEIPARTAAWVNEARAGGGRVVAVGTTSLRALEAAAPDGELIAGEGRTSIFIRPGYRFRIVDALLTNFHLPRSTLLMLVSALAGRKRVLAAYRHAIRKGYRFYSYGDAMWIPRRMADAEARE